MRSPLSYRWLCAAGAAICAGCMGFALYLQYVRHLEPCPMCIFQRVAMIATAMVYLAGLAIGPRRVARVVVCGLSFVTAALGAGVAGRHVWLQSLPPDQIPACGPTLEYMLQLLPFNRVVMMVLKGDGNCAKIVGQWLGITLPGWTMVGFIGLAVFSLGILASTRPARSA